MEARKIYSPRELKNIAQGRHNTIFRWRGRYSQTVPSSRSWKYYIIYFISHNLKVLINFYLEQS